MGFPVQWLFGESIFSLNGGLVPFHSRWYYIFRTLRDFTVSCWSLYFLEIYIYRCCCIFVYVLLLLIAFSAFLGGDFCRIAWLITTVAITNNNRTMPTMPSLTMMEMRSEHIQIRLRRPQRPSSLFYLQHANPPIP